MARREIIKVIDPIQDQLLSKSEEMGGAKVERFRSPISNRWYQPCPQLSSPESSCREFHVVLGFVIYAARGAL